MFRGIDRWLKNEKGQSLVEFAMVLPLLLLLFLGIVQFGQIYNNYIVVENAAREGARAGITGKTDAEINAVVTAYAASLDAARLTVLITPDEDDRYSGGTMKVEVRYAIPVSVSLLRPFLGEELTLASEISMRVE